MTSLEEHRKQAALLRAEEVARDKQRFPMVMTNDLAHRRQMAEGNIHSFEEPFSENDRFRLEVLKKPQKAMRIYNGKLQRLYEVNRTDPHFGNYYVYGYEWINVEEITGV